MASRLHRSIKTPIRTGLSWDERWLGPDDGLVWCWERGRQKREEDPTLATKAEQGELVSLAWKRGTLEYLATWQGLRCEDLDIAVDDVVEMVCKKTQKKWRFRKSGTS